MTARLSEAGRISGKRAVVGITLATAATALLLATEIPAGISPAGGGSVALAELAARSPGMRIGGIALKAKTPRSSLAPASAAAPVTIPAGAAVLPAMTADTAAPISNSPLILPGEIVTSNAPGSLTTPFAAGPAPTIALVALPPIGSLPGFVPGPGGSPGTGGGSTGTTPGVDTPLIPPAVGSVPEPSAWLMLIAGFGIVGGAMRRSRRVQTA